MTVSQIKGASMPQSQLWSHHTTADPAHERAVAHGVVLYPYRHHPVATFRCGRSHTSRAEDRCRGDRTNML